MSREAIYKPPGLNLQLLSNLLNFLVPQVTFNQMPFQEAAGSLVLFPVNESLI